MFKRMNKPIFKSFPLALLLGTFFMNFSITDTMAQSPLAHYFPEMQMTESETRVLKNLQNGFPNNGVRFARQTPIRGLYEVIIGTGVSFVYVNEEVLQKTTLTGENDPQKPELFRYWLFGGVMFDMVEKKELTKDLKTLAQMIDVKALPIKNAIVREKGNAENTLYVFTDPLCPYCAKLEETLATLDNVRIYTFLTPLVTLHPTAREVSAQIWCAPDPIQALENVMVKRLSLGQTPAQCVSPVLANEKLMQTLAIKGTPTIFFADGRRATGALTLEQLIDGMNEAQETQKLVQKLTNTPPLKN